MGVLLAILPVIAVVACLMLKQSSLRAGVVGLAAAAVIAPTAFALTREVALDALSQWWTLVLEVLLIMAGGIIFTEIGRHTGALGQLSDWIRTSLGAGVAPVLAIVHGVTPFAESVTGFGIGAVIAVPLLSALGLSGRKAATIGLLGLCAVPWGSMGPGTLIAAELGGVGFDELGVASAVASLPGFIGVGLVAVHLVAEQGDRRQADLAAVASALALWAGILGANIVVGTAPAGALGALITLTVHLLVNRLRGNAIRWSRPVLLALVPYGVLLGGVIAVSLVVRAADVGDTPWSFLASPAVWLFISSMVATGFHRGTLRATVHRAFASWIRVGPATGLFMSLGILMAVSGMSAEIAAWLSSLGPAYSLVAPAIGAVGGFITGSNTGANAMFAAPQASTVAKIGIDAVPVLAAHNVAAALLTMLSPTRVELAIRLCPDRPERAPVLRTLLTTNTAIIAVLSIGLFAFTAL
ncbi:MAG TPA: L-lactate permease [Candidatus Corynebacterium avicola]|uniref:L-lactate permease n=1 Tax=Candidatus Corynebacterium avicola TaxID=2838527 RepID=A0A9D1UJM3_9CORY|nr:L-lactate permease [Candidatus Corynebacterium avicola]